MHVRRLENNDVRVIEVDDRLNDKDAAAALGPIESELAEAKLVVMDFSALDQIGSAGVGNILRLKTRLQLKGATLRLAALHPMIADVLRKARADHVVEIFDDVHAATTRRVFERH